MSPTVFVHLGFRFYFFSREEDRMHVHIHHPDGVAKFWLEPTIQLAKVVEERHDEIKRAWSEYFSG